MDTKNLWRRHKTELMFGGVVLVVLAVGHKDIERNMQGLSAVRDRIADNNNHQTILEAQRKFEEQQAIVAEARYKDGCRVAVSVNNPRNLATLVENEPVYDRTTGKPLPINTVVCDGNGNTGVLLANAKGLPVVQQIAFTGKRELVLEQIKKISGARLYYVAPGKQ